MSDHLPECPATEVSMSGHNTPPPDYELTYTVCICGLLHACEKRGREDERKRSVLLIADAYGKGLDAAREAVATTPVMTGGYATKQADLAAIDALRGER